jgi:hypothetical protein
VNRIKSKQVNAVGGGKMDLSHVQSHMSVRPNSGFLTNCVRNGIEGKEV